jgi:hypothetical protein
VHVFLAPRQAPLQDRNLQPFAGAAVIPSGVNDGNVAERRGRQVIPACELRTAPFPVTATVSRNDAGAKSAVTAAPGATVTLQPAAPEHAPRQRTSRAPFPGVAVKEMRCPEFHVVVQLAAQSSPGTSDATDPWPEIVTANGTWLSSRTSQAESCASVHPPGWPQ